MPPTLFLLEDEEHLAFALQFNLEKAGYDVQRAGSLAEGRALSAQTPDAWILDVMLPDGTGFDFCRELREAGCRVPTLFLTAKGTADDVVAGLEAGGDDYITKPFALKELLARIAAMLRRRQWDSSANETAGQAGEGDGLSEYCFRDNFVNFTTHEVRVRGASVSLTALELRLLRYFFERPDQVIPREDLLTGVWEVSSQTNTRTVDNFLVRLRRTFELDPARPQHFLTVRGVGYRFVPEPG